MSLVLITNAWFILDVLAGMDPCDAFGRIIPIVLPLALMAATRSNGSYWLRR